jgi:hypothetical protein
VVSTEGKVKIQSVILTEKVYLSYLQKHLALHLRNIQDMGNLIYQTLQQPGSPGKIIT